MAIPSDVALLLDYARAEAKRRGHGQVVLAHVAAALSSKDAEQFAATFGSNAEPRLRSALERLPPDIPPSRLPPRRCRQISDKARTYLKTA